MALDINELAARVAHEVHRTYLDEAHGDKSAPAWEDAPEEVRQSAIARAKGVSSGDEVTSKGDRVGESLFASAVRAVLGAHKA